MSYVSPIDVAKAEVVRDGSKVADLMKFLQSESITDPDIIASSIEGETNFLERIEYLLRLQGEMQAKAKGLADYVKEINQRLKKYKLASESIDEAIEEAFLRTKLPSISTMSATIFTRRNPLGATIVNEEAVPTQFFTWKLDATAATKAAVARETERRALAETFIDGEEVGMILALWEFDERTPAIGGVEVDPEVTYSMSIRRK